MSESSEPPDDLRVRLRWPGVVPPAGDEDIESAEGALDRAPAPTDTIYDLPTAPVPVTPSEPPPTFPGQTYEITEDPAVEPFEPAERYKPAEPYKPGDQHDPGGRHDPGEPYKPGDQHDPGGRHDPGEPYTPVEPYDPGGRHDPGEPYEPVESYEPAQRYEPVERQKPGESYESVDDRAVTVEAVEVVDYEAVDADTEDAEYIHDAEEIEDDEADGGHGPQPRSDIGPGGGRPSISTQELILAGRSDSLQAALASIALRIDALTSTTSTFRNLVSDRITDYAEQVGRLAGNAASDIDEYRHLHERSLEQIRRSIGDAEDNIRRLARVVGDLEAKTGALVAAVRESGDAVDHLVTERDQVSDTLLRNVDRLGQQVAAVVEQGLEDATASLARLEDAVAELSEGPGAHTLTRLDDAVAALTGERDHQAVLSTQLEAQVIGLADDREHGAAALARLERVISEVTANRDRGITKALSRMEGRLDEVAATMTGLSGDDLLGILTRLDARLKDLSTELVTGRDRETSRALAQLSGQVESLAALISEERTDLQPIEARLNRLTRVAASPVDLSDLTRRLDEVVETLNRLGQPDLTDLHTHLDEVSEALARSVPGPDPGWATILNRLERLVPSLEAAPARPAGRATDSGTEREERQALLERFDQLSQQLGEQLESLRRRIALRARPATPTFDADTIAAIADAVAARLSGSERPAFNRAAPTSAPADDEPSEPWRGRTPRSVR